MHEVKGKYGSAVIFTENIVKIKQITEENKMTTAKTILDWNNYDEEFSGEIASRALTIEINDDESVTASEVIGMEDHVETYEDADAAIEYIRDNWYIPEEETFPGDPDLRGWALEALRQYVEEAIEYMKGNL